MPTSRNEPLESAPGVDFDRLTLRDALDLAILVEEEARDRYQELASQLIIHHTPAAAAFFTKMVGIEEAPGAAVCQRTELRRPAVW